jgi:osmotically-inducible protein OsmY
MERKDQRDPYREQRGSDFQQQENRLQDRNERRQFGDIERSDERRFEGGREQWEGESGRQWEAESGRQYDRGGSGYGRQGFTAGQSGQGYYGSRPSQEWIGESGYGRQPQTTARSSPGYYGSRSMSEDWGGGAGGSYGYGGQGYSQEQSGQRFYGSQTRGTDSGVGRTWSGRESMGEYVGRGPKNYLRSDDRIREDVCRRLTEDPQIDASNIDVEVSDREVTLSGTVYSRDERRKAEDCAEQVTGVSHVQNNIRVSRSESGWFPSGHDSDRGITRDESDSLISSEKVEGTAVYGSDRQKIGSIESVMLTKRSGKVAYAVLSFGGFLGLGTEHYPLPWRMLKYDTDLGGYIVNLTKDQLQGAPKYGQNDTWDWNSPATGRQIDRYYDRWMY